MCAKNQTNSLPPVFRLSRFDSIFDYLFNFDGNGFHLKMHCNNISSYMVTDRKTVLTLKFGPVSPKIRLAHTICAESSFSYSQFECHSSDASNMKWFIILYEMNAIQVCLSAFGKARRFAFWHPYYNNTKKKYSYICGAQFYTDTLVYNK